VSGFTSYVVVALIFGVIQAILSPLVGGVVKKNASAFQGGIGIISVLITLVITASLSSDLTVDGLTTWILAAIIIWLFAAIAAFILPFFIVKRAVNERRD
jgi:small-conductance mechanosensitive channel